MGRHSIPDPDEPGREPVEPEYGDYEDYGDYTDYTADSDVPEAPRVESPRASFGTEPAGPPSGGHRNAGEWTGSHRVVAPGRRGVSLSVIAALVGVVVLVAGVIVGRCVG